MSIGDSDAAISVNCKKIGNSYEANIKYYILDYYDWEPNSRKGAGFVTDGEMYKLHEMGFGREFRSIGLYSTTISWKKGEQMKFDGRTNSLIIR